MHTNHTIRRTAAGLTAVVLAVTATQTPASATARSVHGPSTGSVAKAAASKAAAHKAISCTATSSGKPASFYDGLSASYTYDAKFARSSAVPNLDTRTPQGVGAWRNWDGKGHDLLLITAYHGGQHAYVYGINPANGSHVNTAQIAETHGGGVAVNGKWIFISGAGQSIRKYRTSDMRVAMNHRKGGLYVKSVGTARKVHGASFISTYGSYLFAGKFNSTARDRMYAYKVASNGTLTTKAGGYEVPTKTQGVAVTSNRFIFSTSYGRGNRGNIYVVKRGYSSLDGAALKCFRSPSMNEGVATYGSKLYVVFESGSYLYRSDSSTRNVITHLHKAPLSSLTGMV